MKTVVLHNKEGWVKVYITKSLPEAQIILGTLQANEIDAVQMNKQSSSYTIFGEIEIWVPGAQKDEALKLLEDSNSE